MSDYYFSKEIVDIPFYDFPDEFSDSVPSNVFTYPNHPVPIGLCCVIKFKDRTTPFRVFLNQYDKFQAYLTQ